MTSLLPTIKQFAICLTPVRYLRPGDIRTPTAIRKPVLAKTVVTCSLRLSLLVVSLLVAQTSYAQATLAELENGRKINIFDANFGTSDVQVGQIVSDVFVDTIESLGGGDGDSDTSGAPTYSLWSVEPASAARIIQAMPIQPASGDVDIEFLEATTVTVTVRGFDEATGPNDSTRPGFNEVVYTFNVLEGSREDIEPVPIAGDIQPVSNSLTKNQQATQTAFSRACAALPTGSSEGDTDGQFSLRNTCSELALQSDMATSLDRLAAEELFAMGDSLVTTADHQLSNVQSRIRTVRQGKRDTVDISALSLRLWDQNISGSVLEQSKNALTQLAGGGASSDDVQIDSPIGFFANGNIAVGSVDGDGIQRDAGISTNSLSVGADYRIDNNVVVGTAIGIVNDKADFKGDNGDMSMSGFNLTGFGTWYEQDVGYADMVVDISKNDFDLDRRINLPGRADEFASGNTSGTRFTLAINAGRTFQRGATEFGPTFQLSVMKASIDGFNETSSLGNGIAASGTTLNVDKQSITSTRFSLGGEVRHAINTSKAVFVPSISVKLQKENETDKDAITARFTSDESTNDVEFIGTTRDSSVLLLSVGTTAVFPGSQSAFVYYDMRAQDDFASSNRLRVGYRMHF